MQKRLTALASSIVAGYRSTRAFAKTRHGWAVAPMLSLSGALSVSLAIKVERCYHGNAAVVGSGNVRVRDIQSSGCVIGNISGIRTVRV